MAELKSNVLEIAKKIKLLAFDVDGVMTDGSVTYDENGIEYKTFNVKDGHGIVRANKSGFITAIITARNNGTVQHRAENLNITEIYQGQKYKLPALNEILAKYGFNYENVAYMGDDIPDICILEKVGLACCPKDAVKEVSKLLFLEDILNKEIWELNHVEKIKVLLATAIIHKPSILLLDDIFIGLNALDKERVMLLIKRIIRELKIIVVSTTSSLSDTIYSDAILVISDGSIKYSGKLEDILKHDNTLTKLGIEIPIMMDMSLKLQFYNLLDRVILNPEEMVDELWN